MFLKFIVLLLIIGAAWYLFKKFHGRDINEGLNELNREWIESEDVSACQICGVFVTEGPSNCGHDICPH